MLVITPESFVLIGHIRLTNSDSAWLLSLDGTLVHLVSSRIVDWFCVGEEQLRFHRHKRRALFRPQLETNLLLALNLSEHDH